MEKVYLEKKTEYNGEVEPLFKIHFKKPLDVEDGFELVEFEVEKTNYLTKIRIQQEYCEGVDVDDYSYGLVKIDTTPECLQEVLNVINGIEGATSDTMFKIIWTIFQGKEEEPEEAVVYF